MPTDDTPHEETHDEEHPLLASVRALRETLATISAARRQRLAAQGAQLLYDRASGLDTLNT